MSKNLYIHATDSKGRVAERGSPNTYAATYGVPYRPEDFDLLSDSATEATIAAHEQWARNWGSWNVFCKECYDVVRPFCMFPLELAQQYFCFILGMQQWIGEPVGEQKSRSNRRPEPTPTPGPRLVKSAEECEELAEAMDIAIGATREMWAEVVHVGPTHGGRARAAAA